MKQDFLVLYDYGSGGIGGVIRARTAQEIKEKFLYFEVLQDRPTWMSDEKYGRIRKDHFQDIDEPLSERFTIFAKSKSL